MEVRRTEKDFKVKVQKYLRDQGAFVYGTIEAFKSGVPDLFFAVEGKSFWLELKWIQEGEHLDHPVSLQQAKFLTDCNAAGGVGYVLVGRAVDGALFLFRPEKVEKINSVASMLIIKEICDIWRS
jgi:penicillin-binding protein-related factor A (putative recombinase)